MTIKTPAEAPVSLAAPPSCSSIDNECVLQTHARLGIMLFYNVSPCCFCFVVVVVVVVDLLAVDLLAVVRC